MLPLKTQLTRSDWVFHLHNVPDGPNSFAGHSSAPYLSSKIAAISTESHGLNHFPQMCHYARVIVYSGLLALATCCVIPTLHHHPAQPPDHVMVPGLPVSSLLSLWMPIWNLGCPFLQAQLPSWGQDLRSRKILKKRKRGWNLNCFLPRWILNPVPIYLPQWPAFCNFASHPHFYFSTYPSLQMEESQCPWMGAIIMTANPPIRPLYFPRW